MTATIRRLSMATLAAATAIGLSACAGDVNPVRDVFVGAGIGPQTREAPDFVTESRTPGAPGFVPIGVVPPERELAPKSPEEVAEAEEELRRLVDANAARADAARRLTVAPAPEPVRVDPAPAIDRDLAPPTLR